MKDYYAVLEVEKTASIEDIKKAYRRLAHKYHPDKAGGDEAKFKEINEAYQILSNPEKRRQYDRFGSAGFGAGGPGQGYGGFNGGTWNVNMGGFEDISDLGDIFDAMFGGSAGRQRRTYRRGSDLEIPISITLEEAKTGKAVDLDFETFVTCATCKGVGHDAATGTDVCDRCGGKGEIKEMRKTFFGNFAHVVACSKCGGEGKIPKKLCAICKGTGRTHGKRHMKLEIRPAIEDGQIIKLVGMGEAGEKQAGTGDLYIKVRIKPHQTFIRRGNDLYIKLPATIIDILLQKKIEVPLLGGGTKTVAIPSGYNIVEPLHVKGEGMTSGNDLIVTFEIRTPKKMSKQAEELLKELAKHLKE